MVGYPDWIWDKINNKRFQKGMPQHTNKNYNGKRNF